MMSEHLTKLDRRVKQKQNNMFTGNTPVRSRHVTDYDFDSESSSSALSDQSFLFLCGCSNSSAELYLTGVAGNLAGSTHTH